MSKTPGRLHVGPFGRVWGDIHITHNTPFPTPNGMYGSGRMMGVVMHTMVGNLPGTIEEFNSPAAEASAHFGISQTGEVHQFGPIGKSWCAWAQMAGNLAWYSIEHADDGNPANPLTDAQLVASAQIVECLSSFASFPLQISDSPEVKGYGMHRMGGAAWGGHSCPQLPNGTGPRAGQRKDILAIAKEIRKAAR